MTAAKAISAPLPPVTLLDIAEVPYMDSATIGTIVRLHTSCEQKNVKYAIVGAGERIKTLFHVTGIEKVLVQYPTVDAALAAL